MKKINLVIKFIFLSLIFVMCSSYQTQYEADVVRAHQKFYSLDYSTDSGDVSSIVILVKTECRDINEIIDENESSKAIYLHYESLRIIEKSRDETAENRLLNNTPEDIKDYMEALYKYCNLQEFIDDNWTSLDQYEEQFQNKWN